MTGAHDSVIGMDIDNAVERFLLSRLSPHKIAKKNVKISAVVVDVNEENGRAKSIERLQIDVESNPEE